MLLLLTLASFKLSLNSSTQLPGRVTVRLLPFLPRALWLAPSLPFPFRPPSFVRPLFPLFLPLVFRVLGAELAAGECTATDVRLCLRGW